MKKCPHLLAIAALLAVAGGVQAATVDVYVSPVLSTVTPGSSFNIEIRGSYSGPATLAGGAVSLAFDSSVLNVSTVLVNPAVGDFVVDNGTIDNLAGFVDTIGFASFFGVSGPFTLATVSFQVVGTGTSQLLLSNPDDPVFPWTNYDFSVSPAGGTVTPQFTNGGVSVVPLPAGAWLLMTSLLGVETYRRGRGKRTSRST